MPRPVSNITYVAGSGTGTGLVSATASVRLSTVGHRGEAPCTDRTTSELIVPEDRKPRKLVVVAPSIVWLDVAPSESVAISVTSPEANRPLMSEPKKLPPIALTPPVKALKVIESVASLVDSQGLAVVPAPKKTDVSAVAVYW